MSNLVEISHLNKSYGKANKIINDMNINISKGRIIGLLGPNGSGKTTLMKMIAGVLSIDDGDIVVDGNKVGIETKSVISYLPDKTYFCKNYKVKDTIKLFEDFYQDFDKERAEKMLGLLNISLKDEYKKLSKGNKEKVQLVLVMSRKAKLYLLDEPIAGVDPAARDYIMETILSNYNEEGTVIISTHLIADIENILDDAIFIKNGEIVLYDDADNLRTSRNNSIDGIFREVFRC